LALRVAGSGQYQKLIEATAKIEAEVELGERGNTQSVDEKSWMSKNVWMR